MGFHWGFLGLAFASISMTLAAESVGGGELNCVLWRGVPGWCCDTEYLNGWLCPVTGLWGGKGGRKPAGLDLLPLENFPGEIQQRS